MGEAELAAAVAGGVIDVGAVALHALGRRTRTAVARAPGMAVMYREPLMLGTQAVVGSPSARDSLDLILDVPRARLLDHVPGRRAEA